MKPIIVNTSGGRQSLVSVIVAPSIDDSSSICSLGPKFTESLVFRTTVASGSKDALKSAELAKISFALVKEMNGYLNAQPIKAIYLVDTKKFDQQALRVAYRGCGKHNLKSDPEELSR